MFHDVSNWTELQKAVSSVLDYRLHESTFMAPTVLTTAKAMIITAVCRWPLTAHLCLFWMKELAKIDQRLCMCFIAAAFLQVARKTARNALTDEQLDVLLTTCLQSGCVRHCRNARHSTVLSVRQAAKLMKVIVNSTRSTVQLIEIELSKAYLHRALRHKDPDSDSVFCLANVYLAVLYYATGQYQTAIDHCTLVTRSQDHSQCSSHVVEGELLPKIDDEIDTVLGLAVFYQYLRTAALNSQRTQHVSVFTTELFAHYLHIRYLSITTKCRQITQALGGELQRYQKYLHELPQTFPTDMLLFKFLVRTKYPRIDRRCEVARGQAMPCASHSMDTSQLVGLLQRSAVEHLTTFRQLEAHEFRPVREIVTTDFEALYAYKRGEYQRCLWLCEQNVRQLIGHQCMSGVSLFPEFIQLMDSDIVSLIGLALLVDPSCRDNPAHAIVHQLPLSLYLTTQCRMKLHHSVTSMARILHHAEDARRYVDEVFTLDLLLLKLIERKILLHFNIP